MMQGCVGSGRRSAHTKSGDDEGKNRMVVAGAVGDEQSHRKSMKDKGNATDLKVFGENEVSDWDTIKQMMAYVKPDGSVEVRKRVVASLGLLVGSKLLNVQVPFLFKLTGELVYISLSKSISDTMYYLFELCIDLID